MERLISLNKGFGPDRKEEEMEYQKKIEEILEEQAILQESNRYVLEETGRTSEIINKMILDIDKVVLDYRKLEQEV